MLHKVTTYVITFFPEAAAAHHNDKADQLSRRDVAWIQFNRTIILLPCGTSISFTVHLVKSVNLSATLLGD